MELKIFNIVLISLIYITNINYNEYIKKLLNEIITLIWIPIIYCVIKLFNSKNNFNVLQELNVKYMKILFYVIIIGLIIDLLNNYKASKRKYIDSLISYLEYSISIPILINAINCEYCTVILWIAGILVIINMKIYLKKLLNNKKPNLHKMCECPCDSYDDLFESRKKQAESIINYINSYKDNDRFTMLIDSKWGTGKTSLIKAIENKCHNEYNMIFIQPMLFDKKDLLIKYFCERLSEILLKGNIYTGQGSSIQKYLVELLKWTDNKSSTNISNILLKKDNEDFRKIKEELQTDIYEYVETVGKIIVIIDDCDRSDYKTVKEVLMFIRELIDFQAINTIILMQHSKLIEYGFTEDYLDKYIDKTIQLNDILLSEIVSKFIDYSISDGAIRNQEIKDYLLEFSSEIEYTISEIEKLVKEPFINYQNQMRDWGNKKKEELDNIQKKKNEYEKVLSTFKVAQKNIRIIKKIIKEFVDTYYKLQVNNSNLMLNKDDLKFIFKIILIKNLFIDEYYSMQQYQKSQQYFEQLLYCSCNAEQVCIKSLLPELTKQIYGESLEKINRYIILDCILKFECDSVILETKTRLEKILKSIDCSENILEDEWVCNEKNINSINDLIEIFNNLYTYVYNDFINNKNHKLLKNRLKKINSSLIQIPNKYSFNKENIMLNVYRESISSKFEKNEDNYILIKDIYYKIKNTENNLSQKNIDIINDLLKKIREDNTKYIIRFIKQLILTIREDEEINIEYFSEQKDINETLIKKFNLNNNGRYKDGDFKDFENILYEIKREFINNYCEIIDVNYIYTNLSKYILVIKIIKRLEDIIGKRLNIIEAFDSYTTRQNIEYCKDYKKFFDLSSTIIVNMLKENYILEYKDLYIIYGIINNCYNFLSNNNINNLIINIGKACDKFKEKRYPSDYSYYQVQELLICFNKLLNTISKK